MEDKELEKELDKIPDVDENGDPIYKINDLSEMMSGTNSAIGHQLQSILQHGKVLVDPEALQKGLVSGMTAPIGGKLSAVNILKIKLTDAKEVTICDPYFFNKAKGTKDDEYIESLISILPLKTLKKVNIFYQKNEIDILRNFRRRIQSHNILINMYRTKTIHDRVWIVEGRKAFVVGTSFQSIGNSFSFILDIPNVDLEIFNLHLEKVRSANDSRH